MRNITNNDFKNPEKPKFKYLGFKYSGAKLFNMLLLQNDMEKYPFTLIFFLLLSFNKSVKILWIKAKYTDGTDDTDYKSLGI